MNLKISQDTTFYILAPANIDTGGPHDLHQLGFELKNLGKKVFMFYYPENYNDPIHKNYKIYNLPQTNKIEDLEKNILIIPEINKTILLSKKYTNIQKVLWWLSFDYFFVSKFNENFPKIIRSIIKIPFNLINLFNKITSFNFGNLSLPNYLKFIYLKYPFKNNVKINNISINLSQSKYQYHLLKSKNINSSLLYDFIRDEYFNAANKISLKDKENVICYNPRKSSIFMNEIIKKNSDIKFHPLINYNIDELIKILSKSKIYMDFGFHPGVDHLPREAAILNNCILTNKEGSAFFQDAVPINETYKFEEKKENLLFIRKKIDNIFNNFELEIVNFENYRKTLHDEKNIFKNQVKDIFVNNLKN